MSNSIVKDSTKLRDGLKARWKELKLTQQDIEDDAKKHGQHGIIRPAVNKFVNDSYAKGALNESQILWLAWRWLVPVTLTVGVPDKKVKYVIPKKYNEKKALEMLNKIFPESND